MVVKFIILLAVAAVACAADVRRSPFPQGLADPYPGDGYRGPSESRMGDSLRSRYSRLEPDNTKRSVDYASDPSTGYRSTAHKDPTSRAFIPYNAIAYDAYPYGAYPYAPHPFMGGYPYARFVM